MRKVEKLRSGRYKVRFRYAGRESSETFDSHREAVTFAKNLAAVGSQRALDVLFESDQDKTVPTLDQLAADHIAHLTGIEPGTRKTYERLWSRTWAVVPPGHPLGSVRAHHVTQDDIRDAVNVLGETYSRKSLENQRGLLAGVLTRAVEKGYQTRNPVKGIRLPRGKESERVEMRILTPDDFNEVEARTPEHYRSFLRFLWGTGCRWGEAVSLTVGDVQLPLVHIRRALKWSPDGDRRTAAPKTTRSNRRIVIPEELHAELAAACAGKAKGELVFTAPRGGQILHRTFWSRVWRPAISPSQCHEHRDKPGPVVDCPSCHPGIDPRPRLHDLRHSHASWLLGRGVPIHVVQARLGHESIQTTVDTYSHLLPDAQASAAQAAELAFRPRPPELES